MGIREHTGKVELSNYPVQIKDFKVRNQSLDKGTVKPSGLFDKADERILKLP